jgi:hypothetical protein
MKTSILVWKNTKMKTISILVWKNKDMSLETRPEEPQHMAESESPETEAQRQEGAKKPSSTPKAIRLAIFPSY